MSSSADQIPMDVSAIYLDNTSIQVSFTLPTGIVNPYYYYRVVAYDNSSNIYYTTGSSSPIVVSGLTESTTYSYYVETIQYASSYIGNVTTTNNTIYVEAREIYTILGSAASIIDVSFGADPSGLTYYIASARAIGCADVDVSSNASPILITGLSGNTDYSISIKNYTGAISNPVNVKTAIQTPRDVEIASLEDASFTVMFTPPRNSGSNVYYVLRATDMSDGDYIDVSSAGGELSMYGLDVLTIGSTYSFDILTVVDGSMVSYGELFEIGVNTLYNLEARELYVSDPVAASTIEVSFYVPRQSVVTYYIVSVRGDGAVPVDISTNTSPILLTGLSGNTDYSITLKSYVGGVTYELSKAKVKTAIQEPRDVVIASLEDASFTVQFTAGRNYSAGATEPYYILRATDISSGGAYVDVSGRGGELSMYGTSMLASDVMYSFDILTVVDGSMVSYGELFEIGVMTPYNIRALASASTVNLSFDIPAQSGISYYSASAQAPGRPVDVDVISYTSPILLTGLSGNTDYSVTLTSYIGDVDYISNPVHAKTAIQQPNDIEIVSLEDTSFTIVFTPVRNSSVEPTYYILRATDMSGGAYVDVSSVHGELSMYGATALIHGDTYSVDVLTVVDGSMVSYGELFEIVA